MFLDSIFNNFKKYFCTKYSGSILEELRYFSFEDDEQLEKLFLPFRRIINLKRNNLYYLFIVESESLEEELDKKFFYYRYWDNLIQKYIKLKSYLEIVGL